MAIKSHEPITLARDCEAIQIPSGTKMVLPAGTIVMITHEPDLADRYASRRVVMKDGRFVATSGAAA